MFRYPETIGALQIGQNQGLLNLGTEFLLEICSFVYLYVLQSLCITNKHWNMENFASGGAISFHIGPIFKGQQPFEELKLEVREPVFRQN